MNKNRKYGQLVLAVFPTRIGFGFALYKGTSIQDWGIKWATKDKNKVCVRKFVKLINLYKPEILVLEYIPEEAADHRPRTTELNHALGQIAKAQGIRLFRYSRDEIRKTFEVNGAKTKQKIAEVVGHMTPELQSLVPPPRKIWQPEADAMTYFSAASLALTHFHFSSEKND